jgi:hypothetical protein
VVAAVPGLLAGVLLAAGTEGCTAGSGSSAQPTDHVSGGSSSSGGEPVPAARSVPLRTQVTHVAGRLSGRDRRLVAARAGRTISAYVDAAFLDGDYPRSEFATSFGAFTPGAARQARGELSLLTNQPLGATTRTVQATRRTAYLSVLAPKGRVAGVTAAVDLVFRVDRGSRPGRRVQLKGRLLLTKDATGGWAIFGYDLNRSVRSVRVAS